MAHFTQEHIDQAFHKVVRESSYFLKLIYPFLRELPGADFVLQHKTDEIVRHKIKAFGKQAAFDDLDDLLYDVCCFFEKQFVEFCKDFNHEPYDLKCVPDADYRGGTDIAIVSIKKPFTVDFSRVHIGFMAPVQPVDCKYPPDPGNIAVIGRLCFFEE